MSTAPLLDKNDRLAMERKDHFLAQQLHRIETYSPPPLPDRCINEQMPPTSLFNFYDRHIAEHLRLKHVSFRPSLHRDLAGWVDTKLDKLRDLGMGVPRNTVAVESSLKWIPRAQRFLIGNIYPRDLAHRYLTLIGDICAPLAARWIIYPNAPWHSNCITRFATYSLDDRKNWATNYPWKGFKLRFASYEAVEKQEKLMYWLDNPTMEFLRDRSEEDIMIFIFLPYTQQSAEILREMDRFFTLPEFPSSCCSTSGYTGTQATKAETAGFDALDTPWLVPEPRQSADRQDMPQQQVFNQDGILRPTGGRPADFGKDGVVTAEGLLHHIWHLATESNATFVVMNCGNFERIGVRHRGTQTLYLSDLIEVSKAQDPSYAKVYLGLHMAALKDARDRYDQGRGSQGSVASSCFQKRKREEVDMNPYIKRRCSQRNWMKSVSKTLSEEMDQTRPEVKEFWKELSRRSLALVIFQDGILQSPTPASCLRIGGTLSAHGSGPQSKKWKKSYKPRDSVKIILEGRLSQPTGNVHLATIELKLTDGRTITQNVAVKLAILPTEREQLKHEYAIYKHLWKHKVKGISCVFGLFEDFDNLGTMLVIERLGVSLILRKPWDPESDNSVELSGKEKKACCSILTDIHDCRVLHGCIHPRHIMVGHDGKETIIDFSRAKLNASQHELDEEGVDMAYLVAGFRSEEEPE